MLTQADKKLVLYTSVLTAVLLNAFRLFNLREHAIIPHYSAFNFFEFTFQLIWNFCFCFIIGWVTIKITRHHFSNLFQSILVYVLCYVVTFFIIQVTGVFIQHNFFKDDTPLRLLQSFYFLRLFISLALEIILIRLFWLLQERKLKDKENEQLRNAYLTAQLELLKHQLNPHFFFNTLTNLSAIVREDGKKAQQYILDLSKFFRYTLEKKESLVTVEDEISLLNSYTELLKMRFEENLKVKINIDNNCLKKKLPHMSLQPLLENAVNHNAINKMQPLLVEINCDANQLKISNSLQPIKNPEQSTGIGLSNLNERFKILTGKEIIILKTDTKFTVTLPLV